MKSFGINTNSPYSYISGAGLISQAGEIISNLTQSKKVAVITEKTVDGLYCKPLCDSLEQAGFAVKKMTVKSGEDCKSFKQLEIIIDFLAENRFVRGDLLIAFGGGSTGDVAGLAAALYMRGISWVYMPTTLLAAVDSSIGGKTAVNLSCGKNLAGAFHQPLAVIFDSNVLKSLPEFEIINGAGEIFKTGIISGEELFCKIEQGLPLQLDEVIEDCAKFKASLVAIDEYDRGNRALLNLGHTVGHAVETVCDYAVPHGRAVAFGVRVVTKISCDLGLCDISLFERISKAADALSLPPIYCLPIDAMVEAVAHDKKSENGVIPFIYPADIGDCRRSNTNIDEFGKLLTNALKSYDN